MDYETEEQQVEALKNWWAENGRAVVLGVVLGAAGIGGWQGFKMLKYNQAIAASDQYEQVMESAQSGELSDEALAELESDHGDTLYYAFASLAAASAAVQQGDLDDAAAKLKAAAETSEIEAVQHIARIRLARVLGADGKADEGLSALPANAPQEYQGLVEEVRGDLYYSKGDLDAARSAYQKALDSGQRISNQTVLGMKLDDLAVPESDSSN